MNDATELTPDQTLELEWLRRRQQGIGSSDSAVIYLGNVYKKDRVDLYTEKLREVGPSAVLEGLANPAFVRGHAYEPKALELLAASIGQAVHTPQTTAERYQAFMMRDPGAPWLFADLDGMCADGWVAEAKSPAQRNADAYRRDGVPSHNLIQGQHLIHVVEAWAKYGHWVPGLGVMPDGWTCPGVRFAVYEPDNVAVQVYEVERDDQLIKAIVEADRLFWFGNVVARRPPLPDLSEPPKKMPKPKGGKYTPVEGPEWDAGVSMFANVHRQRKDLEAQLEGAKIAEAAARAQLVERMATSRIEAAAVAGWRFVSRMSPGRKGFDRKRLAAEHPEINLARYDTAGKAAPYFRAYAPGEEPEDEEG
jgi:predicted phage-related endonuclease